MQAVEDIFLAAVELAVADRAAYLDAACGSNVELRAQVDALLRSHDQAGNLLEQPLLRTSPTLDEPTVRESKGTLVGVYKLVELIGEGGMGAVWMAQQTEPVKRLVAVKLVKAGMDSHQVTARFEAERQALALMDHPNIAKVLDAGTTTAGRPYFVMDLVKGQPITRYCDEHRLTPRQRVELFVPVCQAIQHAHQKGIIHRDLKPSNILVAQYDGKPVPKVIDFGIAKAIGQQLTDKTLVTGFGSIVGTLEYMSPEQAEINQLDVDTRSDIYALGVLLYELLTGSPPFTRKEFERAGMFEMLRMIREQEPCKPSTRLSTAEGLPTLAANRGTEPATLTRLVRGELDWIVMKALDKDRNRRYETANSLALDVQRYLADEPVQACPPSAAYRLRKLARRHKQALAMLVGFLVMLLVAIVSLAVGTVRVGREKDRTLEANLRLKDNLELALQTLDEIYLKVAEERFARDPARKHEHLELLTNALRFYQQFAQQNSDDPAVHKAQAKAHWRAGSIRVLLDQLADAENDLGQAIRHFDKLRTKFPDDREVRAGLALAHLNLAFMQFRSGRHADALRNLDISQPLLENLIGQGAEDASIRDGLAQALNNRGTLLLLERRAVEAQQAYQRALELRSELVRQHPTQRGFQTGYVEVQINLGHLMLQCDRLPEAREFCDAVIPIVDRLVTQDPTDARLRRQQGVACSNLALALARMGLNSEAEQVSRTTIDRQRQLVEEFGAIPEFQADLALSLLNRTTVLRGLGRFGEIEPVLRESLGYLEPLARDFPGVPAYRRDQALGHFGLGVVQHLTQRPDAAEQSFRQAIAIQKQLAVDYPAVPDYRRDLGASWQELVRLLRATNNKGGDEAERQAAAIWEQLASQFADDEYYRVQLAELYLEQARLLRQSQRLDEAEQPSLRALELWEQLVAKSPAVARHRILLGAHLNNRGQLLRDRGELVRACELFERAIEQQTLALELEPTSTAARSFLVNHYSNLADVLIRRGLHADAARAAEHLPQIVADEAHCHRAIVHLLRSLHLAEQDPKLSATARATAVQYYTERIQHVVDEAERHHAEPTTAAPPADWTVPYNLACAYARLASRENGDPRRSDEYAARAVESLGQAARRAPLPELLQELKADVDLNPLRSRDDFQKLVTALEEQPK